MTPSHAERARTLLDQASHGALGTLQDGYPYTSLVQVSSYDGHPVLLLSDLAEHTKNLRQDDRASLLVWEEGAVDPLATGRVTLLGRLAENVAGRDNFLRRHPSAEQYASFKDFHFFTLLVESARYVGGFGRMSWIEGADYLAASPDPVAPLAAGIIAHMNEDHQEHMLLMGRHFGSVEGTRAKLAEVDTYGFTMEIDGKNLRVPFPAPVATSTEVRQAMIALVNEARGSSR